jgi:ABC-type nitrate/sulfonate/bicarbonate transport system ATPase subunit
MLKVENLSFKYSRKIEYALRDASVECPLDGINAIVGRSGVGKSTLISLLAGIYLVGDSVVGEYEGQIHINGLTPAEIRGPAIVSWVPQVPVLLDHLSVLGNVLLPITIAGVIGEEKVRASKLLQDLGLERYYDSRPRELSVGMKTRVSLLRALISKPRHLFLDEPFVSLDLKNRWRIYELLRADRGVANLATILTTHDIPEATILADRIIVMSKTNGGPTIMRVVANKAMLDSGANSDVCLKTARDAAASIEEQLFLLS